MRSSGPHEPLKRECKLRFYAELNDLLTAERRGRTFTWTFRGTPTVKAVAEALGVPHTEIDLILVDGQSVGFSHRLSGQERVSVYPVFERFDITSLNRLRPRPLRAVRFLADVHLGRLTRYLRMIGFDTAYDRERSDREIIRLAQNERRIILTRDRGLLRNGLVTHGYLVRQHLPQSQLREIVEQFHLAGQAVPFTRCMICNGVIQSVGRNRLDGIVPRHVRESFSEFSACVGCGRVYWKGSHFERMSQFIQEIVGESQPLVDR